MAGGPLTGLVPTLPKETAEFPMLDFNAKLQYPIPLETGPRFTNFNTLCRFGGQR